ncbi:MAG TPA: GNAT family N-acetyltransferase [Candidatus Gastranaerophilaceae bacterium]|nr:GNAT family N-acetyltransferase [Candidatus Gastranaerophilaceae bacterium]
MKIQVNENKEIWDNFVSQSPQGCIFLYSKFLDSLNKKYEIITCIDDGGEVLAGCVILFDENKRPIKNIHAFTQYQGLILKDFSVLSNHKRISKEFKIIEFFIEELTKKYPSLCFCQHYNFDDMRAFQWYNYHEREKGTFKIDLRYSGVLDLTKFKSFDDYLMSVRPVRRQEFNKVKDIEFRWIKDEKILDGIHKKTFERQNIERSEEESALLKSITKNAIDFGYGKLCAAYFENKPISSILFIYDNTTAYYLFGANDPEYRNLFGGNFLMLNMIRDAFENDIEKIDFVGVNSPNRGDYKLSYNGELKPYFILKLEE